MINRRKKLIEVGLPLKKSMSSPPGKNRSGTGIRPPCICGQAGGDRPTPCYIRQPFAREPDFGVTSVNYKLEDLLVKGGNPC